MRRLWEAVAWLVLIALLWGTDLLARFAELEQEGMVPQTFRLVSEQATSAIAAWIMVLFLVHWLRLFPLSLASWPRTVIGHTGGSVIFAFGHFSLMIALRIPWYAINGRSFVWREPFVSNLIVEYQKDIKIYIGFVLVIAAYQFYRRSRAPSADATDRLIVQTRLGEAVLRFGQIDYLEAARNYIVVHADGREFLLRETMGSVLERLAEGPFVQTHRSFIVNMDKVREIRRVDSKQRVVLENGDDVPLSRSYRGPFQQSLADEG